MGGETVKKKGIGMACVVHANSMRYYYNSEGSACFIKVHDDGSVTVMSGVNEIGQGVETVVAQIVAEELGVNYEDVRVITSSGGTDQVPDDLGSYASRTTFISGRAAQAAAADARQKLFQVAAKMLKAEPEELESKSGLISVRGFPERAVKFTDAVQAHLYNPDYTGHTLFLLGQGSVDVEGSEVPTRETGYGNSFAATIFAAHVVQIEVDTETGEIAVLKHSAAVDLGRAINPMACEGQMAGAVAQGMGFTMLEDMNWYEGKTLNANFLDYRLATVYDTPEVETIMVEAIDPKGPFGAKGVGEPAMAPVAAAINNALYNAIGVRFHELPITPQKVLKALKEKGAKTGEKQV